MGRPLRPSRLVTISSQRRRSESLRARRTGGVALFDLHKIAGTYAGRLLRRAPGIEDRNLMHARYGAVRRAGFLGEEFAAQVVASVGFERNAGIAALLRAVMHQPIFANVEIPPARAAAPVVGLALCNVVLKSVNAGEAGLFERLHFVVDAAFFFAQRLHLAAAIVNDADGRSESERDSALANRERILRMRDAAADNRIDIHVKVGVFGEQFQLAVENLQALFRNLVGIHVVDGNLQPLEAGTVEAL